MGKETQNNVDLAECLQPLPQQLSNPTVPRAFVQDFWTKKVLTDIINDFSFEEKQAIYYYFAMSPVAIDDVAKVAQLSQNHTVSTLNLYSERLVLKLDFFKKIADYDSDDLLPVVELLFSDPQVDTRYSQC